MIIIGVAGGESAFGGTTLPPVRRNALSKFLCLLQLVIDPRDPGGGERVRTDDLLRARQALSQLSYTPEKASTKNSGGPGWN